MKILLISDKEEPYLWDYFDADRYKDIELIISCGDLKTEYLTFLVTMINVPLLYVPGNHDTRYIKNPPGGCESIDGKFINFKGIRIVGFGGSYCYNNKEYQYTEKQMKDRISKLWLKLWLNKGFDILVSHAPAYELGDGSDLCHKGFLSFRRLLDKYSPKFFFHGHQHLNYAHNSRIIKYKNTTIVNSYGYHIIEY